MAVDNRITTDINYNEDKVEVEGDLLESFNLVQKRKLENLLKIHKVTCNPLWITKS